MSGAGNNREIPPEEGGDIVKGTGRMTRQVTLIKAKQVRDQRMLPPGKPRTLVAMTMWGRISESMLRSSTLPEFGIEERLAE